MKDFTKSEDGSLLCAEFIKIFSTGLKAVYILKFKNNEVWDDVFYVERPQGMKKIVLVKKLGLSALVILYDVVSLFWCYIISSNFVYNLTEIQQRGPSITIIGGADLPTWSFIMGGILGCACSVLFVLLSLTTVFLFTISILKKQTNRKLNILLCIFLALTLIIYMLIPAQTYNIALYSLASKIPLLKYSQIFYIIISVVNIIFLILPKRAGKNSELHN